MAHVTVSAGERAGNTLEDTVVLLQYGIDTDKAEKLYDLSAFVRQLSGHVISHNRSIVGDGLFEVESGIIVDWWYNCGDEYLLEVFPYRPQLVGQRDPRLVLGKLSGKPSILMALEKSGVNATDAQVAEILLRVKERSIQTRAAVGEADFDRIVARVLTPA